MRLFDIILWPVGYVHRVIRSEKFLVGSTWAAHARHGGKQGSGSMVRSHQDLCLTGSQIGVLEGFAIFLMHP